jgi:PAS domain S-box-containing protein
MKISLRYSGLSLINRVFLATGLVLLLAVILILVISARQDAQDSREALQQQLADDLAILPGTLAEPLVIGDYSTVQQTLQRYALRENLILIKFRSTTGKEIIGDHQGVTVLAPAWFGPWTGLANLSNNTPLILGGRQYGNLEIVLSAQKSLNQSWLRLRTNLILLGIAVLIDFIGIWLVLKKGLAPLSALDRGAMQIAAGNLETRLPPSGSPELRRTIESFNSMASSVAYAQNQLSVEAERLHVTLASIADGVISTDEKGQVVFVNPVAESLTGWRDQEARGRMVDEIFNTINETTRAAINHKLVSASHTETFRAEGTTLLISREGREIPITEAASSIRHADGHISGEVLVFSDQTAARAKEAQLKELNANLEARVLLRTQDLQEANNNLQLTIKSLNDAQTQLIQSEKMASLGGLVAGISHEINTPLGIGVTAASSIDMEVNKLNSEFQAGTMKRSTLENFIMHTSMASGILLSNLKRAAELIKSFKQVAVDQSSDDNRSINLHAYVAEILSSLQPKLKVTAVQVENLCDREIEIFTKPGAIYQILSNLMINSLTHAYDLTQRGLVSIAAKHDGDNIVLTYQDDGKGIPEQDIKRIFDPFFTTKRGQGGSGLGLNIVYNLVVTTLGGSIEVNSKPYRGTTFTIIFPTNLQGVRS